MSGYPNIVHRPIGRFVVSGRCRGWSLPLGRLLIPSSRACLSSFRRAVRFARSHSIAFRLRPAVGYPERRSREASASIGSSPLPPSAVRSLGAIKREEPRTSGRLRDSSKQKGVAFLCIVSCIASIDTEAKVGTKNHLCKFDFDDFGQFAAKNYLINLYRQSIICKSPK